MTIFRCIEPVHWTPDSALNKTILCLSLTCCRGRRHLTIRSVGAQYWWHCCQGLWAHSCLSIHTDALVGIDKDGNVTIRRDNHIFAPTPLCYCWSRAWLARRCISEGGHGEFVRRSLQRRDQGQKGTEQYNSESVLHMTDGDSDCDNHAPALLHPRN